MRSAVAGKARVHELAKELGVQSKTVLAKLKEMGEFVKSASSTVEAPVARRLREEMAASAAAEQATEAKAPKAAKAAPAVKATPASVAGKPGPVAERAPEARGRGRPPSMPRPAGEQDSGVAAAAAGAAGLTAEGEAAVRAAGKAERGKRRPADGGEPPRPWGRSMVN